MREPEQDAAAECSSVKFTEKPVSLAWMLLKINILCYWEMMCEYTHPHPIKKSFHFLISEQKETHQLFLTSVQVKLYTSMPNFYN